MHQAALCDSIRVVHFTVSKTNTPDRFQY